MIQQSRMNRPVLLLYDRIAAIRFILSVPIGQWFGVKALPDYVFNYIYEHGTLEDLTWMTFIDDDTGQRIRRQWITLDLEKAALEAMQSKLVLSRHLDHYCSALYRQEISLEIFEQSLSLYMKTFKSKFV